MRGYSFRKQTRDDFTRRIEAVDPSHNRRSNRRAPREDKTPSHPFVSLIMGFSWFYVVVTVANNRSRIEESLVQGSLPVEYHGMVFNLLAALITVSGVFLMVHLFRVLGRTGAKRANSSGLLTGAGLAVALIYTPPEMVHAGIGMLDDNSRSLIQVAQDTVRETLPGVDFGSIALVSSQGQ
ncbi:hypothetical protein [Aestuariicoccus sp. MJ-SS9]|uniref:hypothetical protein n=1 Tax=Aestuariicoccus sp. MJ-SS9 TaxID=3079855 RepID=UPI00290BF8F7|nr:hypothetical protein [Aestuariicoccus sp. MJ-SS9]MDU8911299.1 hypothetical protein [Aestuariicoccus sp. MJ-SS9]